MGLLLEHPGSSSVWKRFHSTITKDYCHRAGLIARHRIGTAKGSGKITHLTCTVHKSKERFCHNVHFLLLYQVHQCREVGLFLPFSEREVGHRYGEDSAHEGNLDHMISLFSGQDATVNFCPSEAHTCSPENFLQLCCFLKNFSQVG